jgi:hypothetical protein
MEASSIVRIVRAYQAETARRYRKWHPRRTAEACRGWRDRQNVAAEAAAVDSETR